MEVFAVREAGPLIPSSTPVPTTNVPPVFRQDAQARTRIDGGLSLAHTTNGGLDITIWFWSAVMQAWIRAVEQGITETVSPYTLTEFKAPPSVLVYIQTSALPASPANVYLGNCLQPSSDPFPTPILP